jgi:hypothetical protein
MLCWFIRQDRKATGLFRTKAESGGRIAHTSDPDGRKNLVCQVRHVHDSLRFSCDSTGEPSMRREWRDWKSFAKHFLGLHNFPSRAVLVEVQLARRLVQSARIAAISPGLVLSQAAAAQKFALATLNLHRTVVCTYQDSGRFSIANGRKIFAPFCNSSLFRRVNVWGSVWLYGPARARMIQT